MELIHTVINNWEKYNPRKDIKHPTWFALSNRFLEDPELFGLEPIELKVLLYLFCQASQKNSSAIAVNPLHAERVCLIKSKDLVRAIDKFEEMGILNVSVRARTQSERTRTHTSRDTTDRQTDKQTCEFDFEIPYEHYPKKSGKDAGITRLRKRITTQEQFDQFTAAVKKYGAECRREGRDKKFIMLFSTFVGTEGAERWLDYVDRPTPAALPIPLPLTRGARESSLELVAVESAVPASQISDETKQRLLKLAGRLADGLKT